MALVFLGLADCKLLETLGDTEGWGDSLGSSLSPPPSLPPTRFLLGSSTEDRDCETVEVGIVHSFADDALFDGGRNGSQSLGEPGERTVRANV